MTRDSSLVYVTRHLIGCEVGHVTLGFVMRHLIGCAGGQMTLGLTRGLAWVGELSVWYYYLWVVSGGRGGGGALAMDASFGGKAFLEATIQENSHDSWRM